MEKEFEAIKDDKLRIGLLGLKRVVESIKEKISKDEIMAFDFTFMNITKALTELQAIKEANPNEALKCVDVLKEDGCIITLTQGKALETIRQYILNAQEQEKVLEVIFKKRVDIKLVLWAGDMLEAYNQKVREQKDYWWREELTQEEFELLKKWAEVCK